MPPVIPSATYRLQLTANFDFDADAAIVPYLKALGITHLYASPFMKSRKGSTHGFTRDTKRLLPTSGPLWWRRGIVFSLKSARLASGSIVF
jgi:(1->4)-alpha-D-glucan 1-alpha-D-glucosylmutase